MFRPADTVETAEAWELALTTLETPSVLALSRQNLPTVRTAHRSRNMTAQGAYVLAEAEGRRQAILMATGSEVEIALGARDLLQADGIGTRVVSMPCMELFAAQDETVRRRVLPAGPVRVAVEAGVRQRWDRWLLGERGREGKAGFVGMEGFGASGAAPDLYAPVRHHRRGRRRQGPRPALTRALVRWRAAPVQLGAALRRTARPISRHRPLTHGGLSWRLRHTRTRSAALNGSRWASSCSTRRPGRRRRSSSDVTPEQRRGGWHLAAIHRMHLGDLAEIGRLLERIEAGEEEAQRLAEAVPALQMTRNYRAFGTLCGRECHVLTGHHDIEEYHLFPALSERGDAALRAVVERLIDEHRVVHALLERLEEDAVALIEAPGPEAFAEAKATFRALTDVVRSHFGYEETELADAIGVHGVL